MFRCEIGIITVTVQCCRNVEATLEMVSRSKAREVMAVQHCIDVAATYPSEVNLAKKFLVV